VGQCWYVDNYSSTHWILGVPLAPWSFPGPNILMRNVLSFHNCSRLPQIWSNNPLPSVLYFHNWIIIWCPHNKYWKLLTVLSYVTRFAKTGLVRTKWQGTHFTTNQLLHQWTNHPCVCHCQWFTSLLFLGLFSRACLTCSSARVAFKWQWCEWTSIHPAGNRHTTGQKAWPSN